MPSRNARILDWVIKKVEASYPDDVCLLAVYGSYVNRTEGPMSDVDFFYVPASGRAGELCRTFIVEAVAYENQTNYRQGLKKQFRDLQAMPRLPDGFLDGYRAIVEARTSGHIREACEALITTTAIWLDCAIAAGDLPDEPIVAPPRSEAVDSGKLAEGYGELVSTFNKVYASCDSGDAALAFISAVCLQDVLSEEFSSIDLDALGSYDAGDLHRYADHVRGVEARLVAYIEGGASITRYATVDEFLSKS